jgi:hypothetical protein
MATTTTVRVSAPAPISASLTFRDCESRFGTLNFVAKFLFKAHHFAHGRGGSRGVGDGSSRGIRAHSVDDRLGASVRENIGSKGLLQDRSRTRDARIARRYFSECCGTILSRRARSAAAVGGELPLLSTCWPLQGSAEVRGFDGVDHCATQNEGGMPYARSKAIALLSDGVRLRFARSLA